MFLLSKHCFINFWTKRYHRNMQVAIFWYSKHIWFIFILFYNYLFCRNTLSISIQRSHRSFSHAPVYICMSKSFLSFPFTFTIYMYPVCNRNILYTTFVWLPCTRGLNKEYKWSKDAQRNDGRRWLLHTPSLC